MEISIVQNTTLTPFSAITAGSVFFSGGEIYMKIFPIRTAEGNLVNSVMLADGTIATFEEDNMVEPIETRLIKVEE